MVAFKKSAGAYDTRVGFLQRSTTFNAMNEAVETFTAVQSLWADVDYVSDAERLRAGMPIATRAVRIRVRSSVLTRGITEKDRLSVAGVVYDIAAIKPLGRLDRIEFSAEARADA